MRKDQIYRKVNTLVSNKNNLIAGGLVVLQIIKLVKSK
jgi:hypothetical protein